MKLIGNKKTRDKNFLVNFSRLTGKLFIKYNIFQVLDNIDHMLSGIYVSLNEKKSLAGF